MATDEPAVLLCHSCNLPLVSLGTRKFHEGARWGILGQLGELLINRVHFDTYYCPRCGRIHAFLEGVGDSLRAQAPPPATPESVPTARTP